MDTAKKYHDIDGNEKTIYQMVRDEPDWAAVRIQEGEKAIEALDGMRWIPVSERLPEYDIEVDGALLGVSGKCILRPITRVDEPDNDWESEGFEIANCWTVTHWRIPSPPEQ